MKCRVSFNHEAIGDIEGSYEWGVKNWGEEQAIRWVQDLYDSVYSRLSILPLGCPIAPESASSDFEIRQLLLNRYRVLFTIQEDEVRVIHLRGPFHERSIS